MPVPDHEISTPIIHGESDVQVRVGREKRGDETQKFPAVILHCLLPGATVQARVCQIRFHATLIYIGFSH